MLDNQDRFEEEMNQGHTAAWDQDWQKAADHYRNALEFIPDEPNGLVSLGLALFELGVYDEAIMHYSRAIAVSPDDPLAFDKVSQLHEMLGNNHDAVSPALLASELYLKQGNIPKAIECLVRVIRVEPENLPGHSRLALIYERTGRNKQSIAEYLMVASLLQQRQDINSARNAVEHALAILPESREAREALSLITAGGTLPRPISIELEKPRISKKETEIKAETPSTPEASEFDPVEEAHHLAISQLANLVFDQKLDAHDPGYADAGSYKDSGREDQNSSLSGSSSNGKVFTHLRQAVNFWSQESRGAAADELEKALELGLDHPAAYYELGVVRSQEDRLETAIRYLQRSVNSADYALAARLMIARTFRYMDRLSEAATNYLEALRIADAQLVSDDETEDMLRMYTPIIETEAKQTDPFAKNKLCDIVEDMLMRPGWQTYLLQARGDFQIDVEGVPAIPVGELISNPQGSRIVESVRQINQYARSGFWRSAMEEAFFAIQFAPTYLPLHTYMAELLLKQEHLPEAVEKFGAIAKTYRARGEEQHAMRILQRLIKAAPMDLSARNQLISLHEQSGNYEKAIQEKISLAGVYYNLADLSRAREVYLDAFKIAENSRANRDLKVNILYHLADIEMQSLDWKHAEEIYAQIQTIKPDDPRAIEKLIDIKLRLGHDDQAVQEIKQYVSFLEMTDKGPTGQQYLEKLVGEYPDRIPLRQVKAELHQKNSQIEQAIEELDAIGELLLEAGDRKGAIAVIQEILSLNPANKGDYQELVTSLEAEE